jgi:hypothetical protein
LEYRQSEHDAPPYLVLAQQATPVPCHAWRHVSDPIGPQGEADMQAMPD